MSQTAYCDRHGLKLANLAYWLGKQRKADERLTLIPLPLGNAVSGLVLHGASGWCLELPAQTKPDWIADLLDLEQGQRRYQQARRILDGRREKVGIARIGEMLRPAA